MTPTTTTTTATNIAAGAAGVVNTKAEEKVTKAEATTLEKKATDVIKDAVDIKASNYKPSVQPYLEALRVIQDSQAIGGNLAHSAAQAAEQAINNTKEVTKLQEELAVTSTPTVSDNPALTQAKELLKKSIADAERLASSNSKIAIASPSHIVTSAPTVVMNATSTASLIAPSYHVNASTQTNTTNFYGLTAEVLNTRATNSVQLADNSWINNTYRNVIARTNEVKGETSGQYFSKEIASIAPRIQEEGEVNYTNFTNKESIVSKESITRVGESSLTVIGSASPSLDDLNKVAFLNLKPKFGIPNLGDLSGLAQSAVKGLSQNSLFNFDIPEAINNTIIMIKDGAMTEMTNTKSSQFQTSKSQGQQVQVLANNIQNVGLEQVMMGANKAAMMIGNDMAAIGNNRGNGFTMIGKKVFFGGLYNLVPIASQIMSVGQAIPGIRIPTIPVIPPTSNPFLSKDLDACVPNARKKAKDISGTLLGGVGGVIKTPDFNPNADLENPNSGIGVTGGKAAPPTKSKEDINTEVQEALATNSGTVLVNETVVRGNTTDVKPANAPANPDEKPKATNNLGMGTGVAPALGTTNTETKVEGTANAGVAGKATTNIVVSIAGVYGTLFKDDIVPPPEARALGNSAPLCFDNTCIRSPTEITSTLLAKVDPSIKISPEIVTKITDAITNKLKDKKRGDSFSIDEIIKELGLDPKIAEAVKKAYASFNTIAIGGLVPKDVPTITGAITDSPNKDVPSILERGQSYLGTFKSYIEKVPILRDTDLARQLVQSADSIGNTLNNNLVRLTYDVIANGATYETTGGILEGFSPEVRDRVLNEVINIVGILPEEQEQIKSIVEYWAGYLLIGGDAIDEQFVLSQVTTVLDTMGVSADAVSILQSSANLALQIANGEIINLLANPNINSIISKLGLDDEIQKISSVIATASTVAGTIQTLAALPNILSNLEGEGIASLIELGKIVQCLDLFNKVRSTVDILKDPFNYRSATPAELEGLIKLLSGDIELNTKDAVEVLPLELSVPDYSEIITTPIYQDYKAVDGSSSDMSEFSKAVRVYKDKITTIFFEDTSVNILSNYYLIVGKDNQGTEKIQVLEGPIIIYDIELSKVDRVNLSTGIVINK